MNKQLIKFGIFILLMLSFSIVNGQSENNISIEEKLKNLPQKDKALLQQELAAIVILFNGWDNIYCEKPLIKEDDYMKSFSKEEFIQIINELKIQRQLAVVIMDKVYFANPPIEGYSVDDEIERIENFMKNMGFKRIIFQQAVSYISETGLPIIKE